MFCFLRKLNQKCGFRVFDPELDDTGVRQVTFDTRQEDGFWLTLVN